MLGGAAAQAARLCEQGAGQSSSADEDAFGAVADEYLVNLEARHMAEQTICKNRWLLTDLCAAIRERPIADIKPIEIWVFVESIAVGTQVTPRPPHRSVRAGLPHTAPASGHDAKRWFG